MKNELEMRTNKKKSKFNSFLHILLKFNFANAQAYLNKQTFLLNITMCLMYFEMKGNEFKEEILKEIVFE